MSKSVPHANRTASRKYALQLLYQAEILGTPAGQLLHGKGLVPEVQGFDAYAGQLVEGCEEQRAELDGRIVAASENWSLERMPLVDKSLLRMACYEMLFVPEVPVSVSINEAVNLAKEFGGEDSPRFVNGILGRIATVLEGGGDD